MMSKISTFKQMLLGCLFMVIGPLAFAFSWQDLWVTKDKQAEALMAEGQFNQAQTLFDDEAWQAVAAFRAKNYENAAKGFRALNTEKGYYNQGNALAHMGKYEAAIKAYDKALAINPSNEDALYNRKLVESLLQKQQQNSSSKDNKSQNKDKQNQSSSNNNQNNQTDKNQNNGDKNAGKNESEKNQNQPDEKKEDNDKSNTSEKSEQNKPDKETDKNKESEADNHKKNNSKADKSNEATEASSEQEREKQQAKEQWLRLIPDDPGGLMREKFLRDYIKRQRRWYQ